MTHSSKPDTAAADQGVLPGTVAAVYAAGGRLLDGFVTATELLTVESIAAAIRAADTQSLSVLRPMLVQARPGAGWVEDELEGGVLPPGEWWVTDPVEGAINYVHGLSEWAVTATLVRDNVPVLTAVHLPMTTTTYTAVAGRGAFQDTTPLRVSGKTQLGAALVGTGQASPRDTAETFTALGQSVTAMLNAAGVVTVSVPATLQLIHVAAGRMDAFWQHSAVRSGLLAGALLVQEAHGTISDVHGQPWSLGSASFLAAAPGLHAASVTALS